MKMPAMRLASLGTLLLICIAAAVVHAKPTVYTVNYPLQYFAERIAGDSVTVVFPVPADTDPAFWKPDVDTIASFQGADLIISNGATYAKWLSQVSLPRAKMVLTSEAFKDRFITIDEASTHSHGRTGAHSHTGTAFTTWLNLQFAAQQAKAIAQALGRLLPEQQHAFKANYAGLEQDLLILDRRLDTLVAAKRTQPLIASHPVYQYLAARYGLQLQSVLWEPDILPTADQWQALQSLLAKHPAQWMLWEKQPLAATAEKLQAMGIQSLVFDPCGNTPEQGDFLSVMQRNVDNLQQAFQ